MDDIKLIDGIKKQDIEYLYKFIDKYGKIIYSILNNILDRCHEKILIDECFDDILMIIWYRIDSYDASKGSFINWVISVTKHKAVDCKRKSNKLYSLCNIDELNLEDDIQIDKNLLSIEQKEELETYISKLNSNEKKIFILRYLNGESIDFISNETKIPKANVYNRLSRGRKKLKNIMEGNVYEKK